jgi:glutamate racemase
LSNKITEDEIIKHISITPALRETIKIGFADSGVGGMMMEISVLKQLYPVLEFISKTNNVDFEFIHVGHNKYAPFGEKPKEEIALHTEELLNFCSKNLVCDITVLACNTASAVYKELLEKTFKTNYSENEILPIIEPTAKYLVDKAIENRGGIKAVNNSSEPLRIGVLCTRYTNKSNAYQDSIKSYAEELGIKNLELIIHSPKNWVSMIEASENPQKIFTNILKETSRMVEKNNLENKTIDALGLCCTHYPLLKRPIKKSLDILSCNTEKPYSQGKLFAGILTDKLLEMFDKTKEDLNNFNINKKNKTNRIDYGRVKLSSYYSGDKSPEEILPVLREAVDKEYPRNDGENLKLGKTLTRDQLDNFIKNIVYNFVDIEQEIANFKEHGTEQSRVVG